MQRLIFMALLFTSPLAQSKGLVDSLDGVVKDVPFAACKDVIIVEEEKYNQNKSEWQKIEKECQLKIQVAASSGFTDIDPLQEGVQYLDFSSRVAKKVIENLKRSQAYAKCSAECFSGAALCSTEKAICSERKAEINKAMKVFTNRIRMELALSRPTVEAVSVLTLEKEKRINTIQGDMEHSTPNPFRGIKLSAREQKEAMRRFENEQKKLEDEFKKLGIKNYNGWVSAKLDSNYQEHQIRYRDLIYQEAPIFSVIESPQQVNGSDELKWSDKQLADAFYKLVSNARSTEEKVEDALKKSKLEFKRITGESITNWVTGDHDLLYYVGMRNQVEEVLKSEPSFCGVATTLFNRMNSKAIQNAVVTIVGSFGTMGAGRVVAPIFRIGRSLTGAQAAGLTGFGMGAVFLGDSLRQFSNITKEATTKSGLAEGKEGTAQRTGEEIESLRTAVNFNLAFAPFEVASGWVGGKILYNSLAKQMAKDMPEAKVLLKKAGAKDVAARDAAVDKWIGIKLKSALKDGVIPTGDQALFEKDEARKVLDTLISELSANNPDFFKNPKNMDLLFKTAHATLKRAPGDPVDLGRNAKAILDRFTMESVDGSWGEIPQKALLRVYDNTIEELKLAAKNDPATYLKFSSNKDAQDEIFIRALRRSGAKEEDLQALRMCALK